MTVTRERANEFDLGSRVRSLRMSRSLTLRDLASQAGVSASALSKIENNRLSPTYETIVRISEGLGVNIDALFSQTDIEGEKGRRSITRKGEGQIFENAAYRYEMLCTDLVAKAMIPLKARVKANETWEVKNFVRHPGEEVLLVLSGEIELHTELYAPVVLRAGDCTYLDSSMGHLCVLHGKSDAEIFWVCSSQRVVDLVRRAG